MYVKRGKKPASDDMLAVFRAFSDGCADSFPAYHNWQERSFFMRNEDVLKEFIFDCQMRKLSERTIKGYNNSNKRLLRFLETEYGVTELENTFYQHIQGYISSLRI